MLYQIGATFNNNCRTALTHLALEFHRLRVEWIHVVAEVVVVVVGAAGRVTATENRLINFVHGHGAWRGKTVPPRESRDRQFLTKTLNLIVKLNLLQSTLCVPHLLPLKSVLHYIETSKQA